MPKSRKQRTGVKRKKKKKEAPSEVAVADTVAAPESAYEVASGMEDSEIGIEDFADVSEERASIISIVKGLEGQVETAFELKEAMEAELDAAKEKLSEESAARVELEEQVKSLEPKAALADQAREDLTFADEERNKIANLLTEAQQQLEAVTKERDSLAEEVTSAEPHVKELEDEKMSLEAQVMNLKDKVADFDRLQGEVEDLREKLMDTDSRATDLSHQLEEHQAANKDLVKTRTRLESEMKTLKVNHEAAKSQLEAFKKALHDIRTEATRTSGRVRQRYLKPKDKKKDKK